MRILGKYIPEPEYDDEPDELNPLYSLTILEDKSQLVACDARYFYVWDIATSECVYCEKIDATHRDGYVYFDMSTNEGGTLFSTAWGESGFALWDGDSFDKTAVAKAHTFEVQALVFTVTGHVISCAGDSKIRQWNPHTLELESTIDTQPTYCLAVNPKVGTIAAGGSFGVAIIDHHATTIVGEMETRYCPTLFNQDWIADKKTGAVKAVCWHPDGSILIAGGKDGVIRIGETAQKQWIYQLIGHQSEVCTLDTSKDGSTLVSGDTGGVVQSWDISSGAQLSSIKLPKEIGALKYSKSGIVFAACLDGYIYAISL